MPVTGRGRLLVWDVEDRIFSNTIVLQMALKLALRDGRTSTPGKFVVNKVILSLSLMNPLIN
jgi:hypothetical protein